MVPAPVAPTRVFLVGPMGAGKTAIGRELGRLLGYPFRDTDQELQQRTGADPGLIFAKEGEAGFRRRERDVVAALTLETPVVLATGGGAVLDPHNREDLAARGTVVYLYTSSDQQYARTRANRNRPLLETDDPRARLAALLTERDPLYRGLAALVVDTDGRSVRAVARQIMETICRP